MILCRLYDATIIMTHSRTHNDSSVGNNDNDDDHA